MHRVHPIRLELIQRTGPEITAGHCAMTSRKLALSGGGGDGGGGGGGSSSISSSSSTSRSSYS